jgi:hypothetical protein
VTETPTFTPTATMTSTATPTATMTPTPEPTPTMTPTPTPVAPTVPAEATGASGQVAVDSLSPHGSCPDVIVQVFGERSTEACVIALCESGYDPGAIGDHGASLGLFQLWTGWATWYGVPVEALFDAHTNTLVAKAVLEHRGRWGGIGGWSCADKWGIW